MQSRHHSRGPDSDGPDRLDRRRRPLRPSRQQSFVPFAVACVVGELKRYLRDATWRLQVPRQLKERSLNLSKALEELPQRLGRFPTIVELAAHLAVTEEEALEALDVAHTRIACSLDEPLGEVDDGSLADLVAAPEPFEQLEDLPLLPKLLADLPETERKVILLRFFAELSQDEIAARIGFSQMQVSRLLRRAIARMRAQLMPGLADLDNFEGQDRDGPGDTTHIAAAERLS
jgi:RNA polymerase sigma-B factor